MHIVIGATVVPPAYGNNTPARTLVGRLAA
jgi:hypothetical protein